MNFLSNLFSGVKNFFGGASNAVSGALKSGGNAIGGVANAGANIGKNLVGSMGSNPMNFFGSSTAQAAQQPKTSIPMLGSAPMPARMGAMQAFTSPVSASSGVANTTNPNKPKNWMDQLFPGGTASGIAGLAAPAIGNLFAPKAPNIPDINSLESVKALQNFHPGNSVSPEYQNMIQNNVNQLRDKQIQELQALYHNARPGTDYTTDSNYQRDLALINQNVQNNMTDELAKAEANFSSEEQQRLSEIAQMDIYSIMAQTGMKAQEAQQFKEMFSNIGNTFLTNATRDKNQFDLSKLFGVS